MKLNTILIMNEDYLEYLLFKKYLRKPVGIISICTPGRKGLLDLLIKRKKDYKILIDYLHMVYHDLDDKSYADMWKDIVLFDNDHANQVIKFVNKIKNKCDTIICQCEAGISRSAGTAAALTKLYIGDDRYYFNHAVHRPNVLVYKTLLNKVNGENKQGKKKVNL